MIVGSISFLWHLTPVGKPVKEVALSGNATTRIELIDHAPEEPTSLGMWRMEIGSFDSPGACFHAQIMGETQESVFPSTLPVPRVPIFPPTPMAAVEFVLGELFQKEWPQAVARTKEAPRRWRAIQLARWNAFLSWQLNETGVSRASPVIALKRFPPAEIFI